MDDDLPSRRAVLAMLLVGALIGVLIGFLTGPLVWTGSGWVWT